MQLKKLSVKQKKYLLAFGILVILFLIATGRLLKKNEQSPEKEPIANEELLILGTNEQITGLEENEIYTDKGVFYTAEETDWTFYLYQSVQAVTEGQKILHINNLLQREVKLENCLLTSNTDRSVTIFSQGFLVELPSKDLVSEFSDEIADIYLTNGQVTRISAKKDSISGKILAVKSDGIEIQDYGVVPISDSFRFYETYGDYKEKTAYGLVVGYEQVQLIVAEGKICAAVQNAPMTLEKIRVLLKTTDFAEIIHNNVRLKAHGDYKVSSGDAEWVLKDGEVLSLDSTSEYLSEGRVILEPQGKDALLEVKTIERSCGTPEYAGVMEIAKDSGGLLLINELDLETYLYGVVPSEMPASYEMEALKAQAVCARSYAYRQILENGYATYGAHVDDSVSYQVYNNLQTDEKVIRAVNETAGEVLQFGDEVAVTYYYSTSCGYTTNETIWKNGRKENTYLSGKLLTDSMEQLDLTKEEVFRDFILKEPYETYDSGESWYRWDVTVPVDQITKNVNKIQNIGKITDLEVTERNEGGVVQKVLVSGTKGTVEIEYEHAIRTALNGQGQTISRIYGKDTEGGAMLPSGFFVVDAVKEEGVLKGFRFRGGGFGHGAGMSQNGANHMAQKGRSYIEILNLFYTGTELSKI